MNGFHLRGFRYLDVDKLGMSLAKLAEEDPTFQVKTDEASGQAKIVF